MQFPASWFEDEVRDGFYVPAIMKRAWAAELEVLRTCVTPLKEGMQIQTQDGVTALKQMK